MEIGIIVNGFYQSDGVYYQTNRLKESFIARGVKASVYKTSEVLAYIDKSELLSSVKERVIIYLDKDLHVAKMLEKMGYLLFNSANAIESCDDKMLTSIILSGNAKMPTTISSPLKYFKGEKEWEEEIKFIKFIESKIPYPMIIKECHGSMGRQVYLAKNRNELEKIREKLLLVPHVYQKFIKESEGVDVRLIFVGGELVASMKRVNESDFRSNVGAGGKGYKYQPTCEEISVAKLCGEILKLDYFGIDLLQGSDGVYVCEVNSNAFFKEIETISGVDVAGKYADYVINKCKNI